LWRRKRKFQNRVFCRYENGASEETPGTASFLVFELAEIVLFFQPSEVVIDHLLVQLVTAADQANDSFARPAFPVFD
jgi:hypothetical protein